LLPELAVLPRPPDLPRRRVGGPHELELDAPAARDRTLHVLPILGELGVDLVQNRERVTAGLHARRLGALRGLLEVRGVLHLGGDQGIHLGREPRRLRDLLVGRVQVRQRAQHALERRQKVLLRQVGTRGQEDLSVAHRVQVVEPEAPYREPKLVTRTKLRHEARAIRVVLAVVEPSELCDRDLKLELGAVRSLAYPLAALGHLGFAERNALTAARILAARAVIGREDEDELLIAQLLVREPVAGGLAAEALVAAPLLRAHEVLVVVRLEGEQLRDALATARRPLEVCELRP